MALLNQNHMLFHDLNFFFILIQKLSARPEFHLLHCVKNILYSLRCFFLVRIDLLVTDLSLLVWHFPFKICNLKIVRFQYSKGENELRRIGSICLSVLSVLFLSRRFLSSNRQKKKEVVLLINIVVIIIWCHWMILSFYGVRPLRKFRLEHYLGCKILCCQDCLNVT